MAIIDISEVENIGESQSKFDSPKYPGCTCQYGDNTQPDLNQRIPPELFDELLEQAMKQIDQEENHELEELLEELKGSRRFTAKTFAARINV